MPGSGTLALKFRPTDTTCRPLLAAKRAVKGLLVECCKNDLQPGEDVTVKVVAQVHGAYSFPTLADIQYNADSSLKAQEEEASIATPTSHLVLCSPQKTITLCSSEVLRLHKHDQRLSDRLLWDSIFKLG